MTEKYVYIYYRILNSDLNGWQVFLLKIEDVSFCSNTDEKNLQKLQTFSQLTEEFETRLPPIRKENIDLKWLPLCEPCVMFPPTDVAQKRNEVEISSLNLSCALHFTRGEWKQILAWNIELISLSLRQRKDIVENYFDEDFVFK